MAETAKATIARLRRELKAFKASALAAGELASRQTVVAREANALARTLREAAERNALRACRLEGYIDRVREEDARRNGEPVAALNGPKLTSRPSSEELLDWFDPPELVDIGLGADDEDLEAGRLGSDVPR